LNNCICAQLGYFSLKSLLSITNNSTEVLAVSQAEAQAEALTEALAEVQAEALTEAQAKSQAEALAEAQAETQAEVLAEAQAEALAKSLAEALAEFQSFLVSNFLYSIFAFIPKHFNTNLACLSTSDFFKSLLGINQVISFRCSIKSLTLFCIFFGSNFQLSSFNSNIIQ
jgi:hypothetical protein